MFVFFLTLILLYVISILVEVKKNDIDYKKKVYKKLAGDTDTDTDCFSSCFTTTGVDIDCVNKCFSE